MGAHDVGAHSKRVPLLGKPFRHRRLAGVPAIQTIVKNQKCRPDLGESGQQAAVRGAGGRAGGRS